MLTLECCAYYSSVQLLTKKSHCVGMNQMNDPTTFPTGNLLTFNEVRFWPNNDKCFLINNFNVNNSNNDFYM